MKPSSLAQLLYLTALLTTSLSLSSSSPKEDKRRGERVKNSVHAVRKQRELHRSPNSSHQKEKLQEILDSLNIPDPSSQRTHRPKPKVERRENYELIGNWTDAKIRVLKGHSKHNKTSLVQLKGFFGYHSPLERVRGKLVHVLDSAKGGHFGCADNIHNRNRSLRSGEEQPWVALISRGKCLFFNKIQLAQVYGASAVIIYDEKKENPDVMNTVGTNIVSISIGKNKAYTLLELIETEGKELHVDIKVGKKHVGEVKNKKKNGEVKNKKKRSKKTKAAKVVQVERRDETTEPKGSGSATGSYRFSNYLLTLVLFFHVTWAFG